MRHTLAGLGLVILTGVSAVSAVGQTISLSGTWKLNVKESDDPRVKIQEATEADPAVRSGMGSGGRVRTGAGRIDGETGGGKGPGGVTSLPGADFARITRPAELIRVEQNDTIVVIKDERGLPQIFYLDERKVEEAGTSAEPNVTTAKWKDGKLTVDRKLPGTGSIREVYVLDAAGKRLVVDAKLTSTQLGKTVQIRRVYDAGS